MRLTTHILAATMGFAMLSSAAAATTIYAEDFDRANSDTLGNGWAELSSSGNDVRVRSGVLHLRDSRAGDPDAAAGSTVIDALGRNNVTLSFDWRAMHNNETDDVLNVAWAAGRPPAISSPGDWTVLGQFSADGNSIFSEVLSLGAAANNQLINLLFWTDVSEGSEGRFEGFHIDNIAVSAVPLPAGAPLLLAGLAGLGLARRRRDLSKG